jgi:phage-related protein
MSIEERIEQLEAATAKLAAESRKHGGGLGKDAANIRQLAIIVRENNRANDEAFVQINESFAKIDESFVQINQSFVQIKETFMRLGNSIEAFLETLGNHESRIIELENSQ